MKRGLLLAALLALVLPAAAQRPAPTAPQPTRAVALMERALRAAPSAPDANATKSAPDRVESTTRAEWNGQAWSDSFHRRHVYTGDALVAIEYYREDGGSWVFDSRLIYTLEDGQPVEERLEHTPDDGATWEPVSRELYGYADGLISEVTTQVWAGVWQNAEHERFEHDAAGLPVVIETSTWEAGSWHASERVETLESGFDLQLTYSQWTGGVWQPVEQQLFVDRRLADIVAFLRKFEEATELLPESMYGFVHLPDHVALLWSGQAWQNDTRQITSHRFENNEPVEADVRDEIWDGQTWIAVGRRLIALAPGSLGHRPVSLSLQVESEGGWEAVAVELYAYDARGNLAVSEQQVETGAGLENFARWSLAWLDGGVAVDDGAVPARYRLDPAYPNPFNPAARVPYTLAVPAHVTIGVYDVLGRRMATLVDGLQAAGEHTAWFDASHLPSGIYVVVLDAPGVRQTQTATLLR